MVGYRRTVSQQQEHATDRPSLGLPRPGGAKLTYLFSPTHNSPLHIGLPCSTGCFAGKCRRARATMFFSIYRTSALTCACFKRFERDAPRNRTNLGIANFFFSICTRSINYLLYSLCRSSENDFRASFLGTRDILFSRVSSHPPPLFFLFLNRWTSEYLQARCTVIGSIFFLLFNIYVEWHVKSSVCYIRHAIEKNCNFL